MKTEIKVKFIISIVICLCVIIAGVGIGSVGVSPVHTVSIIAHKLLGTSLSEDIMAASVSIIWNIRLPRVLLAFLVGCALAVSGTVMQSVLKNPLASSYTVGVSSGAGLGACLVMATGFSLPVFGMLTLPLTGFAAGMATVALALLFASGMDKNMENNTIILTGMVLSLFINAVLTVVMAMSRETMQRLVYWQMGSFALRGWNDALILAPIVLAGVVFLMIYSRELDLLTFGNDQAMSVGVDTVKVKWILLGTAAALTGSAISLVGVIGFIDLVAPHVVRRIFGSSHRYVLPASALFGGMFMVAADLAARVAVSPSELPVGAVTALIGAPFFAYIYFGGKRRR